MKRIMYATIFVLVILVSFLGITYSYENNTDEVVQFELIGPTTLYMDIGSKYVEYGIKVLYNGVDISDTVKIDNSMVDMNKLGEYDVKYEIKMGEYSEYVYRKVVTIDKSSPVIKLIGGEEVYILLNGTYVENGYLVTDNLDKDLDGKVKIEGRVDTSKEGTYVLRYSVTDSSGNTGEVTRKVIVKKPVITVDSEYENGVRATSYNLLSFSNTVIKNSFTNKGIYYEGYSRDGSSVYKIKLKNRHNSLEYLYNMTAYNGNYYKGNLDLAIVSNGVYDVYIVGKKEEKLQNKLNILTRIVRAKIGNKLVTFNYQDDLVSITIENFDYKYDVVIDPGHGGGDIGSSNGLVLEKDMNLKVSNYEKCRYESMGYRVYMTRYDDTYGEMLGNKKMDQLDRRGLTIGYYGSISRVVYSNHHNGARNLTASGFEILVSNQATQNDLYVENILYNKFRKFYNINDNSIRMYSKNYDTDEIYNKANGEIYDYMNYYAVIRIPYELFNVSNVIYEPMYLTNSADYTWYWSNQNWIKVSEMKIQEYVNYMGGKYNKDNSSCL